MERGDLTPSDVLQLMNECGFIMKEELELAERKPQFLPAPSMLHPLIYKRITSLYPNGLYSHQSLAIEGLLKGRDMALTTTTASGKSLIYMVAAAHMALQDPSARILALYPARALIQDQLGKWEDYKSLGLSIGFIHGGVPQNLRRSILKKDRVILMTPDVAHAWLLRESGEPVVASFLDALALLILDEAHVYEGAFGTNMAYLLRRLESLSQKNYGIVTCSATLGDPKGFMKELTGRWHDCLTEEEDGSPVTKKTLFLLEGEGLNKLGDLLTHLALQSSSPFLAFADSRKQVEQLVSVSRRKNQEDKTKGELDEEMEGVKSIILPYRSGYEGKDRKEIQAQLKEGRLSGVVATSAFELGLDIGEINLVLLLTTPPSIKAFRQRIGRGGRSKPGIYIILDNRGLILSQGLKEYMKRTHEPNYLYLDNPYIQYANVLCAARELEQRGEDSLKEGAFSTLPPRFVELLNNELHPLKPVPEELFSLKQRGEAGPHHEFALRNGIEKQFQVKGVGAPGEDALGALQFSQVLREAYPGGIYYYLARPYRVREFQYRAGTIYVRPEKAYTTKPWSQSIVFPNLQEGALQSLVTNDSLGFVVESHLQVSERVLGFYEKRGSAKSEKFEYGKGSPYYQRPLNHFFETTGVCFYFLKGPNLDADTALYLKQIFCKEHGILEGDIGVGHFSCMLSPIGEEKISGHCLYDTTAGSLRLSRFFAENFNQVVERAYRAALQKEEDTRRYASILQSLLENAKTLKRVVSGQQRIEMAMTKDDLEESEDFVSLIANGEQAISLLDSQEVKVLQYRYTPKGLMYDLEHPNLHLWSVPKEQIRPIYNVTRMVKVNLMTGEEIPSGVFSKAIE